MKLETEIPTQLSTFCIRFIGFHGRSGTAFLCSFGKFKELIFVNLTYNKHFRFSRVRIRIEWNLMFSRMWMCCWPCWRQRLADLQIDASIFRTESGGSLFLRNFCIFVRVRNPAQLNPEDQVHSISWFSYTLFKDTVECHVGSDVGWSGVRAVILTRDLPVLGRSFKCLVARFGRNDRVKRAVCSLAHIAW
jgi:hypothetical protein